MGFWNKFFEGLFKGEDDKDVKYYRKPDGKIIREEEGVGKVISPDQVPEGATIEDWPAPQAKKPEDKKDIEEKFRPGNIISEQGRPRQVTEAGTLKTPEDKK